MTASRPSEERPAPAPFTDEERDRWRIITADALALRPHSMVVLGESELDDVPRSRLLALLDRLTAAEQRADEAERRLAEIREAWGCRWQEQDGRRQPFTAVERDIASRIDAALAASPESHNG